MAACVEAQDSVGRLNTPDFLHLFFCPKRTFVPALSSQLLSGESSLTTDATPSGRGGAEPAPWRSRAAAAPTLCVWRRFPRPTDSALQVASSRSTTKWRCMTAISVVTAARVVPAAGSCGGCCSSAFAVGGSASHSRTDGLRAAGYATPSGVVESHAELGDFQRLLPYVQEHTFGYVLSQRSTP